MAGIILLVMVLFAGNAEAATNISSCQDIPAAGEYVLNATINNASTCITITSSNVILDGAGHTINGTNTAGTYGVYVYKSSITLTNVTVKNLKVTNWFNGIYYQNAQNGNVANNTASSNSDAGIYLVSSSNNNLTGNTASSNPNIGIVLDSSSNNNLTGNTASSNPNIGIYLADSSNNNLTNNTASSNGDGIHLDSSSNNNLTGNTASSNTFGIYLETSSNNNNLTGNNASSNGNYGIYLETSCNNNNLTSNNASSNYYGIVLRYSNGNNIYNNYFNNTNNASDDGTNTWNTTQALGTNIVGGPFLGGNFWASPDGTGFSQTCSDNDIYGICDLNYGIPGGSNIDYLPLAYPTFNISGYKINDTNGNGVSDSGESGIQGWNITLKNATGNLINTTATNSEGFYQFTNIEEGSYNVTEEDRAGWNHTNATLRAINLSQNITNLNFTNRRVFSVNTSTGTGTVYLVTDAGTIQNLISVNESDLPAAGEPNMQFPNGFLSFNITGLNLNQTVNVTIVLPQNLSTSAQYWKYGRTFDNPTPHWYQIPLGSNDGDNVITIQLQDGGIGDDDGTANGEIVEPGGGGLPNTLAKVPALNPAGLVALVGALSFVAISRIRRRGK